MRKFKNNQLNDVTAYEISGNNYKISHDDFPFIVPAFMVENSKEWVEIFEHKFKNGDVVKIIDEFGLSIMLITNIETGAGYGLINNNWRKCISYSFNSNPQEWQLATQDEWLEALTKEAEKKYKVRDRIKRPDNFKYSGICVFNLYGDISLNGLNNFYYKGKQVMQDGVWAEVVKEETLEDLAVKYHKYILQSFANIEINYKTFFTENKETIHRLSK